MFVRRLILGALETNCWVVADDEGGPASSSILPMTLTQSLRP